MNRKQDIAREVMARLAEWDAPALESIVYASTAIRFPGGILVSEFDEAIKWLESERYVTGVRDELRGVMWALTNKGRAARQS